MENKNINKDVWAQAMRIVDEFNKMDGILCQVEQTGGNEFQFKRWQKANALKSDLDSVRHIFIGTFVRTFKSDEICKELS